MMRPTIRVWRYQRHGPLFRLWTDGVRFEARREP